MFEIPQNTDDAQGNVFHANCPARFLMSKIGGKWSLLIIDALKTGPMRNGALMRQIEGVSQKMLTQSLRELVEMQLVAREDIRSVPPHVEYSLTPLGEELREKVCALDRWIEENMLTMIANNRSIPIRRIG